MSVIMSLASWESFGKMIGHLKVNGVLLLIIREDRRQIPSSSCMVFKGLVEFGSLLVWSREIRNFSALEYSTGEKFPFGLSLLIKGSFESSKGLDPTLSLRKRRA